MVASSRDHSRNSPTVRPRERLRRRRGRADRGSAGSPRRGRDRSGGDRRSRSSVRSARTSLAATRSRSVAAASPASWSPDFSSLALAKTSRRSANANRLAADDGGQVHTKLLDQSTLTDGSGDGEYSSDSRSDRPGQEQSPPGLDYNARILRPMIARGEPWPCGSGDGDASGQRLSPDRPAGASRSRSGPSGGSSRPGGRQGEFSPRRQ